MMPFCDLGKTAKQFARVALVFLAQYGYLGQPVISLLFMIYH